MSHDALRKIAAEADLAETRRFRQDDYDALHKGVESWNEWRMIEEMTDSEFKPHLDGADLRNAKLAGVDLTNAFLRHARLEGADLQHAKLQNAQLDFASIEGGWLAFAQLQGSSLCWALLNKARCPFANFEGAHLIGAELRGAILDHAQLTGVTFELVCIDETLIDEVQFGPTHVAMHDRSDSIVFPARDRWLNWGLIRRVSTLPLFEISYLALAASLVTITTVGYLNETTPSGLLSYPVPLPARMMWLLLSSLSLVIGTTMYRLACPPRVQEFSETQWVEQHGRPRLQYLAESLKRGWQIPTAMFTGVGGILGVALLVERLWVAFLYVAKDLMR